MKIVVIGAAPTGLGVAYHLHKLKQSYPDETKNVDLLVLEKESFAGGLSRSVTDEKGFIFDMGCHVTFSQYQYYEEATKWAVEEWNNIQRNCQVDMNYLYGKNGIHLVPYPAQFAVPFFPEEVKQRCLNELNERYENASNAKPENFEDWCLQYFGPTIHEIFLKPYNRKVWTVDPAKMNPTWVGSRVAKLPKETLERLCSLNQDELRKADFGWGPNAIFTFSKYGGTGNVWKSMAAKLPKEWFRYNAQVDNVDVANKQVTYSDVFTKEEVKVSYDVLINTSAIDIFVRETKICPELNLVHNKVFVVGVGLELPMPLGFEKFSWLYFPDPSVPFYRVTFLSNYGETTPDNNKYWSLMCECARPDGDLMTEEEIRDRAIEGLIRKTIIKQEQIVSIYSTTLPYGYPVPSVERDAELARAHRVLERNQIYSRGRFGGWKYEASNQDHCFIQGKEIIDRLILGIPEKLYKTGLGEHRG